MLGLGRPLWVGEVSSHMSILLREYIRHENDECPWHILNSCSLPISFHIDFMLFCINFMLGLAFRWIYVDFMCFYNTKELMWAPRYHRSRSYMCVFGHFLSIHSCVCNGVIAATSDVISAAAAEYPVPLSHIQHIPFNHSSITFQLLPPMLYHAVLHNDVTYKLCSLECIVVWCV